MSRRHAPRDPFVDECLDLLSVAGSVRPRPIFGGTGIFRGPTMFAFVAGRRLFFKTDALNRARFEEAGASAYVPSGREGWRSNLSYHELPAGGWEDASELRGWVDSALAAARRDRDPRPG